MSEEPRWRRRVAVGVAAVAVARAGYGTNLAWASDSFSAVPTTHPFHDQVGWLADTGISTGYGDGTFRPGDPVSRGAMAAFMQRLFDVRDDLEVASSAAATDVTATTFADVPGASVTVEVPPGTTGRILAELTGETTCAGSGAGFCEVQILVDGAEMSPVQAQGVTYAMDSNDNGTETTSSPEGHAIVRHTGVVPAGTYTITVQAQRSSPTTSFALADWVLVGRAVLEPTS